VSLIRIVRATPGVDVEHESLRQLVKRRHRAEFLTSGAYRLHSDQVVEIDLVLLERRQLAEGSEQIASTPQFSAVAVLELLELHEQALLEWPRVRDRERRDLLCSSDVTHDR